jgi:lipid A 3-O-deacylase
MRDEKVYALKPVAALFLIGTFMAHGVYAEPGTDRAASTSHLKFTESGGIVGYGQGNLDQGYYRNVLFIWHLSADLKYYTGLSEKHGQLSVLIEPQINPVIEPAQNIEFGIGLGLQYMYPVTDNIRPYVIGSVGPHYISTKAEDTGQASGFAIASTIGAGIYYVFDRQWALNLGYRFRHISNADLKAPNGSINTQNVIVGLSLFF